MTHLDRFTEQQRAALDLLSDTFRNHWTTPLEQVHVVDPARVSLDLEGAANLVIRSEAARLELARRAYLSLMGAGVPEDGTADDATVREAYHDRRAQSVWAQEVIHWLSDLMGHLQDEAAQSGATH